MNVSALITTEFLGVALVFARIGGILMFMPGLGEALFPVALDVSANWVCKGVVDDPHAVEASEREREFLEDRSHETPLRAVFVRCSRSARWAAPSDHRGPASCWDAETCVGATSARLAGGGGPVRGGSMHRG